MTWQSNYYRFIHGGRVSEEGPLSPFGINEQCFIRKEHKCGKIFGASKSCFIACPTDYDLEPILELMSEKLMKAGVEPIIAVKERAYGQDIFCTKICGKIIESRFCLVILNDAIAEEQNIPNPNVYYEYGLMTSLRKHIIPLQKDDLKLAFNIQSYDTIKYNPRNIASELDRAFKDAIRITESKEKEDGGVALPQKTLLRKLELADLELKDEEWFLYSAISDTNFKGFGHYKLKFYVYLGKVDDSKEFQTYLEDTDVILHRTEKKHDEIMRRISSLEKRKSEIISEMEKEGMKFQIATSYASMSKHSFEREIKSLDSEINEEQEKISLMETIFIGFIINSQLNSTEFKKKMVQLISQYRRYNLAISTKDSIEFGELKIHLEPPSV